MRDNLYTGQDVWSFDIIMLKIYHRKMRDNLDEEDDPLLITKEVNNFGHMLSQILNQIE